VRLARRGGTRGRERKGRRTRTERLLDPVDAGGEVEKGVEGGGGKGFRYVGQDAEEVLRKEGREGGREGGVRARSQVQSGRRKFKLLNPRLSSLSNRPSVLPSLPPSLPSHLL